MSGWRPTGAVVAIGFMLAFAGCTGSPADEAGSTPTLPPPYDAERSGTVDLATGETIGYRCLGEGEPAVMLEAGTDAAGTSAFPGEFVASIAEDTTVCVYDRPGTSTSSSDPPDRARGYDDLIAVLDGVLAALELEPPYVVAGQSGGGNIAISYAMRHPERVAGVVTIDSYHDDPSEMAAWQAEEGFTWEDNPEHVDWVQAAAQQDAHPIPIGEFPVRILSATQADPGGVENQAYWLGLSSDARQIVIEGPHDLQWAAPDRVAAEFRTLLDELQR